MGEQTLVLAPGLLVLVAALATVGADAVGSWRAARWISVGALAGAGALSLYTAASVDPRGVWTLFVGGGGFAAVSGVVYLLAALSLVADAPRAVGDGAGRGQTAALVSVAAVGCAIVIGSSDLLVLVLGLEAVALAGCGLVSASRHDRADEAAMKYFVMGSVATGMLVYGTAVGVGLTGATGLMEVGLRLAGAGRPAMVVAALALTASALAVKSGAFPFHSWVPDAYETARPSAAAFLSSGPKIAALVAAFVVFRRTVFGLTDATQLTIVFAALAAGSIVFGNLAALRQTSFARMLGYSAIAQTGYALVGVAAGPGGLAQFSVFVAGYAVAAVGAFATAQAMRSRRPEWDGSIGGLAGAGGEAPVVAAAVSVCLLSLTGIPLTFGFLGKLLVFGSAVQSGLVWLAVVGVLGSVVSFGYYGRVIRTMYFEEAPVDSRSEPGRDGVGVGRGPAIVVGICAAATLFVGVYPLFGGIVGLVRLFAFP